MILTALRFCRIQATVAASHISIGIISPPRAIVMLPRSHCILRTVSSTILEYKDFGKAPEILIFYLFLQYFHFSYNCENPNRILTVAPIIPEYKSKTRCFTHEYYPPKNKTLTRQGTKKHRHLDHILWNSLKSAL